MVEQSHDRRSRSPLVGQEGDINDAVIENIVEEDSSNGDEEEGKLKILGKKFFNYQLPQISCFLFKFCLWWYCNFLDSCFWSSIKS